MKPGSTGESVPAGRMWPPEQNDRINLAAPSAVAKWCKELGCSPADLRQAVRMAGSSPAAVRDYLERRYRR